MRFHSITLRQFSLFKESNIQNITVTFNERVQIIIGPNGSGKSVFTEQLSPYPSVSTLFGKTGFKSQVMEKDGQFYTLQSDHAKSSSPHLFLDGLNEGENLNIGRTGGVQKELIVERLGITPLLDDLILNRNVFPKWTPAKRKEFLMSVNPDQIGFVLALAKQQSSKIKGCKSNLARLQARRILLEADLLTPESYAALEQERDDINRSLVDLQAHLMTLEVGLRSVGSPSLPNQGWSREILHFLYRYQTQLSQLQHIDRHDPTRERKREALLGRLAVVENQLVHIDEDQEHQSVALTDLETRYRELDLGGDLQELDATISRLETQKEGLIAVRPSFDLSPEDLQKKYDGLDQLISALQVFNDLGQRLLPQKRRQHRERMLYMMQGKQNSYRMRLAELEDQAKHLAKQHKTKPQDIPNQPCAKERCPLFVQFFEQWELAEQKRDRVQRSIEKGLFKIDRLDRYVEALITYLESTRVYHDRIQWLLSQASNNPILYSILSKIDVLSTLSTSPNRIVRLLEDAYDQISVWHKSQSIQADLDVAYALKQRHLSQESGSTVQLVKDIEAVKKRLSDNRDTLVILAREKVTLVQDLDDINRFSTIKQHVLELRDMYLRCAKSVGDHAEREALLFLKSRIESMRQYHFSTLGSIETRLRTQASLKERLQEEVVSQIVMIEQEMSELQEIEAALLIIPRENMTQFINSVFKQANILIEQIWTIPLAIELVSNKDELTYEFMVIGDNQSERELSKCSAGQTEILSLAINLSLRIILGYLNYPLILDETDRTLDDQHRKNFVVLLKRLVDENIISQLFMVSHQAIVHAAFANSETLVIREDNILLPPVYNQHVTTE